MTTKQLLQMFGLTMASLAHGAVAAPSQATLPLVFNTTPPVNDLTGSLAAQVLFAQSQIFPAHPRQGDHQPHLTSLRACLLLVRPLQADDTTPIELVARDGQGRAIGTVGLNPPRLLPKTAYHVEGAPKHGIDFNPASGTSGAVREPGDLEKLSDPSSTFLLRRLRRHALVEIETANGQWVRDIYLPQDKSLDGVVVRAKSQADYGSTVYYSGRQVVLEKGQVLAFKCVDGEWFREGELDNNTLTYASDAWSGFLPADWIAPGLRLEFRRGKLSGELTNLKVGAPSQLLIHTIDIGMLTTPRGAFAFAKDPEAHREYFQTLPAAELIVSQYAPLHLSEVMMPTGVLLKSVDESVGGWHTGDMRQHIGKELISHGIDNANYGLNSTPGQGEASHPYVAAQLAAHNSRGNYSNGVQVHGGSGGDGIVTLDESVGNEFSHEVGHNYGLGHYVDGFKGSVHRPADQINSTWGWDANKERFLPNFGPLRSGKDTCLEKECQSPFDGRSFGLDAMAGGAPLSGFNRFTLYTPNSAAIIQRFLESKAVFDANSPTGFAKWNDDASRMEPYSHRIDTRRKISATITDLDEAKLAALLAEHDVVNIAMSDGHWIREVRIPPASAANRGRVIAIRHDAMYPSSYQMNGQRVNVTRGLSTTYTSDAERWNEGAVAELGVERKPKHFGVPVVTLVGYYDPTGSLTSYIYPALHGAYGFCYAADSSVASDTDCRLVVETRDGERCFRLTDYRFDARCMNKFHVNIPAASRPTSVAVVSRGKVLDKKSIKPVAEKLTFTVNGALSAREPKRR